MAFPPDKLSSSGRFGKGVLADVEDADVVEMRPGNTVVVMGTDDTVSADGMDGVGGDR